MQRAALTHAYTRSISTIWIVNTPIMGVGFFLGEHRPTLASDGHVP